MATIKYINTGSSANSGDGDSLRTAFTKINSNFDTLVESFVAAGVTSWNGQVGVVNFTNQDLTNLLGFVPYPETNPAGYVTSSTLSLTNYATVDYVNQSFVFLSDLASYNFASTNYVDLKLTEYPTLAFLEDQQYLTSVTLPNFLTFYVTQTQLAQSNLEILDFTTSTIFKSLNESSLIPGTADIFNLGDEAYRWSTLYLANAVYIQGIGISVDPVQGRLLVDGNDPIGDYLLIGNTLSNKNQSSFYISNAPTAGSGGESTAWIEIPGLNSEFATPLILENTDDSGIVLRTQENNLIVDSDGISVQGTLTLSDVVLQGAITGSTTDVNTGSGINVSGNNYVKFLGNGWLIDDDRELPIPQSITSYQSEVALAPLMLKGKWITLSANEANSYSDTEPAGVISVDSTGVYIGLSEIGGDGDPSNLNGLMLGYKLPLTKGTAGQVLAITTATTDVDIVDWVTIPASDSISITQLKTIVAASTDFADFKSRIAAL
jgi:hypothetical protein